MMHADPAVPCPVPAEQSHAAKLYILFICCISLGLCSAVWNTSRHTSNALQAYSGFVILTTIILFVGIGTSMYLANIQTGKGYRFRPTARWITQVAMVSIELFAICTAAVVIFDNAAQSQYGTACAVLAVFWLYKVMYTSLTTVELALLLMPPGSCYRYQIWPTEAYSTSSASAGLIAAEAMATATIRHPARSVVVTDGSGAELDANVSWR